VLKVSRILKDYRETGALSRLIALWGFVDDTTFLTKSGSVGVVFRLQGVDDECLDHADRQRVAHDFEQALRQLDDRVRVYQYLIKQPATLTAPPTPEHPIVAEAVARRAAYLEAKAGELYTTHLYLVLLLEGGLAKGSSSGWMQRLARRPLATLAGSLSERRTASMLTTQLDRACAELHQKADTFAVQIHDSVRPRMLEKHEAFAFFRRLLNYGPAAGHAALKYDTHLDFFLSDATVECHRDHLDVGGVQVKVLTMKEPPARTFAHVLSALTTVPGSFIACLEWQRIPDGKMRRELHTRRRHHFNRKVSLVNYVSPQTRPEEMLVDESAGAVVAELGACLTEMELDGHFFGAASLSIALADTDTARLHRSAAECAKVFAAHDGSLIDERYNLLNAWLSLVPGNSAHNLRRLALLNTNVADLSFLFATYQGESTSSHLGGRACLATLETTQHTPYFFNLHVDDVGHAVILGATGSGKSFLMNFLLTHAQAYDPTTVIFDLGGGYDKVTTRLGGSVWRLGLTHRDCTINPFCLEPTAENFHFLFSFVRVLLGGDTDTQRTSDEDREIYEAVQNVYSLDHPQRRLSTLLNLLPRELARRLHRWVAGGPYADLFDNVDDTLTFSRLQCFDFDGLERYPLVLEPLLFYVLHRASVSVREQGGAGDLKLFLLDEAWRFAADPIVRGYMTEALKTWRKRNAAMILATQSIDDFASVDLLRTVVESCPTKIFLANPGMDRQAARALFHLNETETDLLGTLRPRQQLLLKRPNHAKVLTLDVDPESYWLYTNTPRDNARLQEAVLEHGTDRAIHILASQ
jgi:type IV secretion system protein TrbE